MVACAVHRASTRWRVHFEPALALSRLPALYTTSETPEIRAMGTSIKMSAVRVRRSPTIPTEWQRVELNVSHRNRGR